MMAAVLAASLHLAQPDPERVALVNRIELREQQKAVRLETLKRDAEKSLASYVRQAWHTIEPATPLQWGWHLDAIADHLEAVTRGEIRKLIINIPPRMTKSLNVSVFWPTWEWVQNPGLRGVFVSYASDAATPLSLKRRNVIQSDWYQQRWGDRVTLAPDQNLKTEFENTERGAMFSTSVGGTLTGRGGLRIVIDDPHNPKEALSDVQRQAAIDFYRYTLSTRLDNPKKGAIVLIMQRLHEEDLTGYLMKSEPGQWVQLRLPMRAEGKETVILPSGKVHEREDGELLSPERFGPEEVATIETALGSYGAAGQLQQRPSPAEGGMLKRAWWKRYTELPADPDEVLTSWDCAFKDTKGSDYVVGTCWHRKGANMYLKDLVRARLDFPATCTAIRDFAVKHPEASGHLIEDKANGPAVIATLANEIPGLIAVNPEGGKEARANAAARPLEAGNIHLPESAAWVGDFIEECAGFPRGRHDDQVDSFTQAVIRMLAGPRGYGESTDPDWL